MEEEETEQDQEMEAEQEEEEEQEIDQVLYYTSRGTPSGRRAKRRCRPLVPFSNMRQFVQPT